MFFIYSPDCNKLRLIYVIKDVVTVRIVGHYLTGDIMKYVKNIFLCPGLCIVGCSLLDICHGR